MQINKKTKLVQGVGINDADYPVQPTIDGKRVNCPFYWTWTNVLKRCYSSKYHESHPTYIGCTISEEWKTFSNFKKWMEKQDWEGNQLDKDILVKGNKNYSADTCVFVSSQLNNLLLTRDACRGEFAIGVSWDKKAGKFQAKCNENGKQTHLGRFLTEIEASRCYTAFKNELFRIAAEKQTDIRIKEALLERIINP